MFTSRLPKSTSARRPSNPNDGSTSLIGSNIPISVRKANLFTPQPKRSLQGINSTSRKSFMTTDKKYQRTSKPAPDRDEQIRMFDNLVDFLRSHAPNFPLPEAKRFFSSVSTTECTRIFEFLISRINPDFKINKLEIDVQEALASLDYPYIRSVTKSALVSITTRQNIANLLIIFDWLVNFVRETEDNDLAYLLDPNGSVEQRAFYCLMTNSQDPTDDQLVEKSEIDHKREELDKIRAERERISKENQDIEDLELEKRTIIENLEKYEKYEEDMKQYIKIKRDEELALQEELINLDMDVAKMSREHEILLPSFETEMDDGLTDPAIIMRLEKQISLTEQEIEEEKQDNSCVELHEVNKKCYKELESLDASSHSLAKELAAREENKYKRLKDLEAETQEVLELNNDYLRKSAELCKNEVMSIVNEAQAAAKYAMEAAELVKEDNGKLRKVALALNKGV